MIALLVDIGNSRIKWRIAHIEPGRDVRWLTDGQSLATSACRDIAARFADHDDLQVDTALCSNVASDDVEAAVRDGVARVWRNVPLQRLRPTAFQGGVVNGYRDPGRLGPDRWLAMIGAHARYPAQSLLVCSFGTATTIDLLIALDDGDVRFTGGLILPGFDAMRESLASSTARLPLADGRATDFADATDDAITSGIAAAQVGTVERAWRKARIHATVRCILAGGSAATVAPLIDDQGAPVVIVNDLVLCGMAAIADQVASPAVVR